MPREVRGRCGRLEVVERPREHPNMLEAFIIFARGGIILFSWTAVALKGNPVDALVSNVLLEERSGKSDYTYTTGATKYTLKWSFHNELELVFVAVRVPPPVWPGSRRMSGSFLEQGWLGVLMPAPCYYPPESSPCVGLGGGKHAKSRRRRTIQAERVRQQRAEHPVRRLCDCSTASPARRTPHPRHDRLGRVNVNAVEGARLGSPRAVAERMDGLDWTHSQVYQSMLQLLYVDDLLSAVRAAFVEAGGATAGGGLAFNEDFVRLMLAAEAKAEQRKLASKSPATKSANVTPSSKMELGSKKGSAETLTPKGMPTKKVIDSEDEGGVSSNCSSPSGSAFDLTKLKGKGGSASKKNKKGVPPLPTSKEAKGKPKVRASGASPLCRHGSVHRVRRIDVTRDANTRKP